MGTGGDRWGPVGTGGDRWGPVGISENCGDWFCLGPVCTVNCTAVDAVGTGACFLSCLLSLSSLYNFACAEQRPTQVQTREQRKT